MLVPANVFFKFETFKFPTWQCSSHWHCLRWVQIRTELGSFQGLDITWLSMCLGNFDCSGCQQCPFGQNRFGPGAGIPSIIIYLLKGVSKQTPLLINQPMGKWLCSVFLGNVDSTIVPKRSLRTDVCFGALSLRWPTQKTSVYRLRLVITSVAYIYIYCIILNHIIFYVIYYILYVMYYILYIIYYILYF